METSSPPSSPPPINNGLRWLLEEPNPTEEILQFLTDSEDEAFEKNTRGPSKDRKRFEGDKKLVQDYFEEDPVYNSKDFER